MTALLTDHRFEAHHTGHDHPETPARNRAVIKALDDAGWTQKLTRVEARKASLDEAALCHSNEYLQTAEEDVKSGKRELSTGDTNVSRESWDVALLACGGVLAAVDQLAARKAENAFCAVRPPGHHATPDRGMGFCLINNVAVAARYAQAKHGYERVLIVDWDVHHGNGTQDIFYEDDSVLFFSTHQYPWYPGTGAASETGAGKAKRHTINCPLPAGSGMPEISACFRDRLLPAADQFKPDMVIVSAGFDSREGDPLGRFLLTDANFKTLTNYIREIASKHAGGRVLSVLEGGYNLSGLASAVVAHVEALVA